jgi:acyl-CoA thioesterase FadM
VLIYLCFVVRFTVEVADFDFGQGVGDMEYKTFRERLREAVVNSLNRDFGVDGEGNVWSPSRKYGSMH